MGLDGVQLDKFVLTSAVSAYSAFGFLEDGRHIQGCPDVYQSSLETDALVVNAKYRPGFFYFWLASCLTTWKTEILCLGALLSLVICRIHLMLKPWPCFGSSAGLQNSFDVKTMAIIVACYMQNSFDVKAGSSTGSTTHI